MTFDSQTLENLLYQPEGPALDFKEGQYRFNGASDDEKSELLKDILALANSWRLTTASILIGVREVKGGRSKIIGVSDHLDDASLHQFVNSKTQRPVQFSHQQFFTDGVDIDVIRVPMQDRPIFLTNPFGKLQAHEVKVRDGSSTRNATPDEIAKMGIDESHSGWTSERIITFLEKSLSNIDELKRIDHPETPEFKKWHRANLHMINSVFGRGGSHYWDYRDAADAMHPVNLYGFFGYRLITGSWRKTFGEKLHDTASVLISIKNEIEQYGYMSGDR